MSLLQDEPPTFCTLEVGEGGIKHLTYTNLLNTSLQNI